MASRLAVVGRRFLSTKKTTGLVGLEVNAEARKDLLGLYRETLVAVQALPEDAEYRKSVEKITKHRLNIVEKETDVTAIEDKIDCGQIEELVIQAKDELSLIPKMAEWKPWESQAIQAPHGQWDLP